MWAYSEHFALLRAYQRIEEVGWELGQAASDKGAGADAREKAGDAGAGQSECCISKLANIAIVKG